jgi:DNA-directed RNA polymerase subunit RPC12/RpoP
MSLRCSHCGSNEVGNIRADIIIHDSGYRCELCGNQNENEEIIHFCSVSCMIDFVNSGDMRELIKYYEDDDIIT